jgi:hypothetical protein
MTAKLLVGDARPHSPDIGSQDNQNHTVGCIKWISPASFDFLIADISRNVRSIEQEGSAKAGARDCPLRRALAAGLGGVYDEKLVPLRTKLLLKGNLIV